MSAAPVKAGDLLAGKYLVDRVLGQGGMGIVVAARHLELDERVAIKFLLPEYASHGEVVARFLREGRAAVKIRSEHVARVTDVGRFDDGSPYMVMEYLDGCDLAALLQKRGPLPIDETVLYVLQACEALAEAHALGIIHRDLKPPNLFLTHRADGSPCVKVLDFGIAKFTRDTAGNALTKTKGTMGSALYMSPEQLKSAKDVDARSDVWALGIILFELLAGQQPFLADDLPQLIVQVFHSPPTQLRSRRPDAPAELQSVIECCLEKDRELRFNTVAALASALLPFAGLAGRVSVERIGKILKIDLGSSPGLPAVLSRPATAAPVSPTELAARQTDGSWGGTRPDATLGSAPKSKTPIYLAIALVAALVGGGVAIAKLGGGEARVADPLTQPVRAAGTPLQPDVPGAPSGAVSASTRSTAAASPSPPVSAASAKSSVAPRPSTPNGAPSGPSKAAPATAIGNTPSASSSCTPPYYYDANNIKHYKQGCE